MRRSLGPAARATIALPLALAGVGACRAEATPKPEKVAAAREAREVEVTPVTELSVEKVVEISGTLAADEQVTVAAKVAGRVASVSFDLSSAVKKDQVLVSLDSADFTLRVRQAEAALAQAQAQLGVTPGPNGKVDPEQTAIVREARATLNEARANVVRARALAAEGLMTGMQLDAAEAAVIRAETAVQSAIDQVRIREAAVGQRRSELGIARQQLADSVIRSPIDGVVQRRFVSVGEYVAAGAPVAEVVRLNPLRLRVAVPEREASALRQGQIVRVRVQGDDTTYTGTLARLAPALDPQSRTLLVEADIENPGTLRPGTFATARIIVANELAPTVPKSAVVTFAGLTKVFVVEDGRAVERRVTLGKSVDDRVEIVAGVKPDERVVVKPGSLQTGEPVRVKGGERGRGPGEGT